jgi:hypothetical protein
MKSLTLLQLVALASVSLAFTPQLQRATWTRSTRIRLPQIYMTQWDDEDEPEKPVSSSSSTVTSSTSFDDAGETLKNEADQDRMDSMGEYDANPAVRSTVFFKSFRCLCTFSFSLFVVLFSFIL